MNIYAFIVTIVYLINIIVVAGMVFFKEKDVKSTMGWIFIFMLLPFVGYIFYFLIGSTTKFKILSRKYSLKKLEEGYRQVLRQNIENIETGNEALSPDFSDMIEFNAKNGGCVYSADNDVELFTSAKEKYERMFSEIENARESINVLYFIIKTKDDIGKKFISLLAKKAREGVEVRLIYDRLGMMKNRRTDFKELTDAGGMVYAFLPSVLGSLIQANYRMHRKIVVIDGQVAYTGGINIGDDYLGFDPRVHPWRDTAIRITGSAVQAVQLRFLSDWEYLDKQAGRWRAYPSKVDNIPQIKKYFKIPEKTGNMGV
ncbi:MAG: PLDc N-terminal domain-containing protein, partial [Clostridia bacterium]|nr:PLDc N-terminal domain-containing protein [Clostridia bacterium]